MRQELEQDLIDLLEPDDPLITKVKLMSIAKLREEIALKFQVPAQHKKIDLSNIKPLPPTSKTVKDPSIIHFGKHKGTKWNKLPLDYLVWLHEQGNPNVRPHLIKRGFFKKLNAMVLACHSKTVAQNLLNTLEWTLTPKQKNHLKVVLTKC